MNTLNRITQQCFNTKKRHTHTNNKRTNKQTTTTTTTKREKKTNKKTTTTKQKGINKQTKQNMHKFKHRKEIII